MFKAMKAALKGKERSIVFTEGYDSRILKTASRLLTEGLMRPILLGQPEKVKQIAAENGIFMDGIEIVNPVMFGQIDQMVTEMARLRKGKMTVDECREALQKANYFGTMMVKMGVADGLLGGATYSTADTVRPALQIIKTKPGSNIVSSCFVLSRFRNGAEERYMMADCAINLNPTGDDVAEIAAETAACARLFAIEPKVALLSFSTLGSGTGESADKMRYAAQKLKDKGVDFLVDGELQFDAAFSPEVAKTKAPASVVAGQTNTFIFPNIDSGNIGYKIAQRLGGFEAFGPILLGLNAPINDLSRGCTADEVYKMAIITMSQVGR